MKTFLAKTLIVLIGSLPLGLARFFGGLVGEISYRLNSRGTQVARTNIGLCFPALSGSERQQLLQKSMHEWGKTAFEMPVVWRHSDAWLEKRILRQKNPELMETLLQQDKGIIVIAPHLGNWEVIGLHLAPKRQLTCLYQPPRQAELESIIISARCRNGAKLAPTNRRGVMTLVKALRNGEMTGILPDQEPKMSGGIFAPFFGVSALTMTLLQNLLKSTGACAVVAAARRVPGGFEMVYQQPDANIYSDDTLEATAALNRSVEGIVKEFPEQYQWEYKRFKKRPEGEDKIYR